MTGLAKKLQEQGRSKAWLAKSMGVYWQTVHNWCIGEASPSDKKKIKIAKLLNCTVQELFFDHLEEQA